MALLTKSSPKAQIVALQAGLTRGGYSTQGVDGIWGSHTQAALDAYHDSLGKPRVPWADEADQSSLGVPGASGGGLTTPSTAAPSIAPVAAPSAPPLVATTAIPLPGGFTPSALIARFTHLSTPAKVAVAGAAGLGVLALAASFSGGKRKRGLFGGLKSLSGLPTGIGALPIIGTLTLGKAVALGVGAWLVKRARAQSAKTQATTATAVSMSPNALAPDDPDYFNQDASGALSPYATRQGRGSGSGEFLTPSAPTYVDDITIPGSDGSAPVNSGMTVSPPDSGALPTGTSSGGYQKPTVATGIPNGSKTSIFPNSPLITTTSATPVSIRTPATTVAPNTSIRSASLVLRGVSLGHVSVRSPFHLDRVGGRYKRARR